MGQGYEMLQTKVSPETYRRIKHIELEKGLNSYVLLQMMADCIVRYMDDRHNLTEEMEKVISIFEHMEGWHNAFNLADPSLDKIVGEAIYFLYDSTGNKKGARAVIIQKPFFGNWNQDFNIQHIFDRFCQQIIPQRFRRLKTICNDLDKSSIIELLDFFIDQFEKESDRIEMRKTFEDAYRASNNKEIEYEARTRRKHHVSPDDMQLTLNL